MTRAELLERLDYLENHDPRRDPRHTDCSVWIWERDELIRAQANFDRKGRTESLTRPPLGENSLKALANLHKSVEDTALLIAVELTEKGYTVERWPPKFDSKSGKFAIFNFLIPYFSMSYCAKASCFGEALL